MIKMRLPVFENRILKVMVWAIAGWAITFFVIKLNIREQPHLPAFMKIADGNKQYDLKVTNLDTLQLMGVEVGASTEPSFSVNKSDILLSLIHI